MDLIGRYAIVIGEDAADPDVGGDLVLGHADDLAAQVFGPGDALRGVDVDARVAKYPGEKGRDADVLCFATGGHHRVAAHRYLGDIELAVLERTVKGLFGFEHRRDDIDAVDRHATIEQGARAVVAGTGKAQLQLAHGILSMGFGAVMMPDSRPFGARITLFREHRV